MKRDAGDLVQRQPRQVEDKSVAIEHDLEAGAAGGFPVDDVDFDDVIQFGIPDHVDFVSTALVGMCEEALDVEAAAGQAAIFESEE